MTHIMIDVETLGTVPGSVIRSVGAIVFDPRTGNMGRGFEANIDRASCEAAGLTVDPETEAWWAGQSAEAQAALEHAPVSLAAALACLASYYTETGGAFLWANDPCFDKALLDAAFRAVGLAPPWKYNAGRSCRTIYDLAGVAPNRDVGVHHTALTDARNQAIAVHDAYVKLGLVDRPPPPTLVVAGDMPPGVADVLGIGPGLAMKIAHTFQALGHPIRKRFEDENAAVRWFLLPFAINHGADWWPPAAAAINRLIDESQARHASPSAPTDGDQTGQPAPVQPT